MRGEIRAHFDCCLSKTHLGISYLHRQRLKKRRPQKIIFFLNCINVYRKAKKQKNQHTLAQSFNFKG